jgi:hypothetical protein
LSFVAISYLREIFQTISIIYKCNERANSISFFLLESSFCRNLFKPLESDGFRVLLVFSDTEPILQGNKKSGKKRFFSHSFLFIFELSIHMCISQIFILNRWKSLVPTHSGIFIFHIGGSFFFKKKKKAIVFTNGSSIAVFYYSFLNKAL